MSDELKILGVGVGFMAIGLFIAHGMTKRFKEKMQGRNYTLTPTGVVTDDPEVKRAFRIYYASGFAVAGVLVALMIAAFSLVSKG